MHVVPGLTDNIRKGIRRGRFRILGADIRNIFEPVIQRVIGLIMGQIEATLRPVKAVLLVGGFGQNGYLRDRIRQEIGKDLEVMQSPNG